MLRLYPGLKTFKTVTEMKFKEHFNFLLVHTLSQNKTEDKYHPFVPPTRLDLHKNCVTCLFSLQKLALKAPELFHLLSAFYKCIETNLSR